MEFIRVLVKGQSTLQVAVLVNGQKNGMTGQVVTLGSPGLEIHFGGFAERPAAKRAGKGHDLDFSDDH